jgi:hypothetical protein
MALIRVHPRKSADKNWNRPQNPYPARLSGVVCIFLQLRELEFAIYRRFPML